jgi:CheY-like chemotaxis protein
LRELRPPNPVLRNQSDNPSTEGDEPAPSGERSTAPLGVLVVDDELSVRSLLDMALRQQGFAVWQAANGNEALELYRDHCRDIALVLLDVRMPGLDGVQTLTGLQAVNPNVLCCFMSGHIGDYSQERLVDLGAARVFAKPFRVADIVQVAQELTARIPR